MKIDTILPFAACDLCRVRESVATAATVGDSEMKRNAKPREMSAFWLGQCPAGDARDVPRFAPALPNVGAVTAGILDGGLVAGFANPRLLPRFECLVIPIARAV